MHVFSFDAVSARLDKRGRVEIKFAQSHSGVSGAPTPLPTAEAICSPATAKRLQDELERLLLQQS